jgi:hypothetical protein
MAGRRRKWLIAAALLAIVVALTWALLGRDGRMDVQLVFVRYTNYTATFTNPAPGAPIFTRNVFSAVVMATNSGNVAVELLPPRELASYLVHPTGTQWLAGFALLTEMKLPNILKPGETLLVEVEPQTLGVPWYTVLMAQQREIGDRLYLKAAAKGGAVLRLMWRYFSPPPEMEATLGPVTNAPPQMWADGRAALGRMTNPPPDMEPVLDAQRSERQRRPAPSLFDGGTNR